VRHDSSRLDHLPLPAHVHIRIRGDWRSGWLIACDRQLSGWHGLVQYQDEDQPETTVWLPAEEISW
jgi:hypothetical protein